MSDDIAWDTQEMDCDNARATTITQAKAIPAGYEIDPAQRVLTVGSDPTAISFASFLYGNKVDAGPLLEIPAKLTDGDYPGRQFLRAALRQRPQLRPRLRRRRS